MIYDISPLISDRLAVWPGDSSPRREVLLDIQRGDNITLSTLHATVHLGAHADAPSHYGAGAAGIDSRSLDYYLGRCQVVRIEIPRGTCIEPAMIGRRIDAERVLFATGSFPDPNRFNTDFAAISPECVDLLHRQGVILVGIDTPSVDLFASKDLPCHRMFLRHDMAILEGLALDGVPEGTYELIALPLRLVGCDASPVRAVLRTLEWVYDTVCNHAALR
jgi:arylformamidase